VHRTVRHVCLAVLALGLCAETNAEEAVPAVYQRSREVSFVHGGGHGHHGGGGNWGGGQWGGGFYNPWFGTQFYAGTWYQRPYPSHLDFNNVRSHMVPVQQVAPDCPCAE
jgi:hypothetical protein